MFFTYRKDEALRTSLYDGMKEEEAYWQGSKNEGMQKAVSEGWFKELYCQGERLTKVCFVGG